MAVERIQKILSNAGVASRRVAEQCILDGRITVNGEVRKELGSRADPDHDDIRLDGVPVTSGLYRYFLLNKPRGFVTTARDELNRDSVLDLVPIGDIQLHPVGRLDKDSEGLLLLTNDGRLTDLLTHPRYGVLREYLVAVDAMPSRRDLQRLVRGMEVDGDRLKADSAVLASPPPLQPGEELPSAPAWLLVALRQGKNREVRRLLSAVGLHVLLLRRVRYGPLHLGQLGSGAFRELSAAEVQALYKAATPGSASSLSSAVGRQPH